MSVAELEDMERTDIRRIVRPVLVALILGIGGALVWSIGLTRRAVPGDAVWTSLWPRPDGSIRSYGEVWDLPGPEVG